MSNGVLFYALKRPKLDRNMSGVRQYIDICEIRSSKPPSPVAIKTFKLPVIY